MKRSLWLIFTVLLLLGCNLSSILSSAPAPTDSLSASTAVVVQPSLVAQSNALPTETTRPTATAQLASTLAPTRAPEATSTPNNVPPGWTMLKTVRFSILVPSAFEIQVPLRDVRLKSDSAQMILMGRDRETGFLLTVTETPLLFGTAQKKMENRKSDVTNSRDPYTILKTQTGFTVNGRETAILEYVHADQVMVSYYFIAGQEEFEITIDYGKPTDANFIPNAERIASSFLVDATPVTPTVTRTPGGAPVWTTQRSSRFTISIPSTLNITLPLRDVRLNPGTAQLILMGEDRDGAFEFSVTETPALFGNAQRKLENRKSDLSSATILKIQSGITVNGRDAAMVEFVRANEVTVEYFIVAGPEEFDIAFRYGNPNDASFIPTAERIANSFTVDASATSATPAASNNVDAFLPHNVNRTWWFIYKLKDTGQIVDISSITVLDSTPQPDGTIVNTFDVGANYSQTHDVDKFQFGATEILMGSTVHKPATPLDELTFKPAVPVLRLPLQAGQKWNTQTQIMHSANPASSASVMYAVELEYRGPVSVGDKNYPDCVRTVQTVNGQLASKWTYCSQVGPVLIEQPTAKGTLVGELTGTDTARLTVTQVAKSGDACVYTLAAAGFELNEDADVYVVRPDGKTATKESKRITAQDYAVTLKVTPQDSAGLWTVFFNGTQNTAMHVLHWTGKCE